MVFLVVHFIFLVLVVDFVAVVVPWAKAMLVAPKTSERPSIVVMIFFIGVFLLDYVDDSRPSCKTIMPIGHETTLKTRLKWLH